MACQDAHLSMCMHVLLPVILPQSGKPASTMASRGNGAAVQLPLPRQAGSSELELELELDA